MYFPYAAHPCREKIIPICNRFKSPSFHLLTDEIYLQTGDGELLIFPRELLPYATWIESQTTTGKGTTYTNPIPIPCDYGIIATIIADLQTTYLEYRDINTEGYDTQTLQQLAACSAQLGSDLLNQAYQNTLRASFPNPQQVFTEISQLFTDDHIIINLYLVIMEARTGTLLNAFNEQDVDNFNYITQKYHLYLTPYPTAEKLFMITKEPINAEQLLNNEYLAYLLDYRCNDPNYTNIEVPRIGYRFTVSIHGINYNIMSFVCTEPHRVSKEELRTLASRFQDAINLIDPNARVDYRTKELPPIQRATEVRYL